MQLLNTILHTLKLQYTTKPNHQLIKPGVVIKVPLVFLFL